MIVNYVNRWIKINIIFKGKIKFYKIVLLLLIMEKVNYIKLNKI